MNNICYDCKVKVPHLTCRTHCTAYAKFLEKKDLIKKNKNNYYDITGVKVAACEAAKKRGRL